MTARLPVGSGRAGSLSRPAPGEGARADGFEAEIIDLRDIWSVLRRQRGILILTFLLVLGSALLYTWLVTPVWYAETLIRVDDTEGAGVPVLEALSSLQGGGEIETEMRILSTRPVGEQVVDELDMVLVVESPREVSRDLLFAGHEFGRETVEGSYSVRRVGPGRYRIRSHDDTPALDLEFAPGDRVELPGGWFALADLEAGRERGGRPLPTELEIATLPFQEAVKELFEDVTISRPDREANVVDVGFRTTDRTLVHQVPNRLGRAFITQRIASKKTEARSTVEFLEQQAEDLRLQLEDAERELQAFREGQQIVALGAEAEAQVERLATLQTERTRLDAERAALERLVREFDTTDRPDYRRLASFPTFFRNEAVASLLAELIAADATRRELLVRLTPNHPDVVAVQERIDQLEQQLGSIGRNYLGSLDDQIESYDAVLSRFGAELEEVPEREIQFARLERRMTLLAELYTLLQTRLKEAQVAEAVDDSSVRIVEEAIEPLEPVSPRPLRNVVLGSFLGLMLGIGLALLREFMDRRLHSSDRIEALFGVPTMARIPTLDFSNGREGRGDALVALEDARSVGAESFRNLRTNVRFVRRGHGASEIVITSPSPGEGKSLTAANLAITLAQRGHTALLVDADMRRPVQHEQFRVAQTPGLSDCLLAGEVVDGTVRTTMLEGLHVMPAGQQPPNPAELLDSPQMNRLLELLRERYESIIIDSPPVLAVTDSAVLAPKTDGVILVVRAEKTEKDAIALAIQQLHQVEAELLGIVVNDAKAEGSYQSYYREYYGEDAAGGLRGLLERFTGVFS